MCSLIASTALPTPDCGAHAPAGPQPPPSITRSPIARSTADSLARCRTTADLIEIFTILGYPIAPIEIEPEVREQFLGELRRGHARDQFIAKGLGLGRDGARVQLRHVGLLRVGEGAFLHDPRLAIAPIRDPSE